MKKVKEVKDSLDDNTKILNLGEELDKARKYMDKYTKAKNFNSSRQDSYAENMAFYQGNQHLLKKYKNDTPWVINMNTPYATVAIDNRVSSLLANDYIGDLLPLGSEDVESVETLDKVYKKEWKRLKLDNVVRSCIRGAAVVREFYCHIVLDNKQSIGSGKDKVIGKLEAYAIEPARIYIDPNARCLRDANYMFVMDRISKEEAVDKYDKLKQAKSVADSFTPSDRGEVYYDNDYTTEQEDVFTKLTYYGKEHGKIRRVKMINSIIVEEKVMPLKNFPVLQFRWKKAAQSCYGLSLMDEVLSLQKAITSIESAITNTAVSYAAPSMMVRKGCGVDPNAVAKANGAPGVVYAVEGNLDNAIKPVIPPKIQDEILSIKTDFQNQIDKITGNSNQFLGDIGTAGNTSGGANIAVERAKIIEIDVLNNIREFIEDISNTLVEYIKNAYAGETLTYNDGKKVGGGYNFTKIKLPAKDKLDKANYEYYIELDTKTPYSKDKQKELLLELFRLERQYDTPIKTITVGDIIKNTSLENRDEIIERFNSLSFQDSSDKAQAVDKLLEQGKQYGVPQELLIQAVSEIIGSDVKHPAVDEVLKMLEDAFSKQVQANEQKMNNAVNTLMTAPQQQGELQQLTSQIESVGQKMNNQNSISDVSAYQSQNMATM